MPIDRNSLEKALLKKGFILHNKGRDHRYYHFTHNGKTTGIYTKISRGKKYKTISDSLASRIKRQLKLDSNQFDKFIECPMKHIDYILHLQSLNLIE